MKQYVLKKDGLYYGRDNITDIMPTKLQEFVKINKGVTLRDIFRMLNKNKKFFSILFKEHYCKEYIKLGLNIKSCGTNYFDTLIIYLSATIDESYPNKNLTDLNYVWYVDGIKDKQAYAIDLSHLSKLIDVPITIGEGCLTNFLDCSDDKSISSIKLSSQPTLYDVLNCLLNEISFHGLPKQQKEFNKKLDKIMSENNIKRSKNEYIYSIL